MKNFIIAALCLAFAFNTTAQLKTKVRCAPFEVDILDGKVNLMKPTITSADLKSQFPCFTSAAGDSAKCGEAVYYKDKDITFFTGRDYVEIGEKFKGKLSIPLIGASRGSLFKWLGNPAMKDDTWDAFKTAYGTLVLHYNKAQKVRLIQFSTKDTNTLSLCE